MRTPVDVLHPENLTQEVGAFLRLSVKDYYFTLQAKRHLCAYRVAKSGKQVVLMLKPTSAGLRHTIGTPTAGGISDINA